MNNTRKKGFAKRDNKWEWRKLAPWSDRNDRPIGDTVHMGLLDGSDVVLPPQRGHNALFSLNITPGGEQMPRHLEIWLLHLVEHLLVGRLIIVGDAGPPA